MIGSCAYSAKANNYVIMVSVNAMLLVRSSVSVFVARFLFVCLAANVTPVSCYSPLCCATQSDKSQVNNCSAALTAELGLID